MYLPPHFREDSLDIQHKFMRENPLGLLVTHSAHGLIADAAPFILDEASGEFGTLRAHLSRANPQYKALAEADECIIIFQGPQAYITPTWYETKQETGKVVPTWNYVTVHAWGRPQVMEDPAWLRAQIEALTTQMESGRTKPWAVSDAPEAFVQAQMKGIFGIEIPINRIEGKWKVSQNRPEADRLGVIEGLRAEGQEKMAREVEERG